MKVEQRDAVKTVETEDAKKTHNVMKKLARNALDGGVDMIRRRGTDHNSLACKEAEDDLQMTGNLRIMIPVVHRNLHEANDAMEAAAQKNDLKRGGWQCSSWYFWRCHSAADGVHYI